MLVKNVKDNMIEYVCKKCGRSTVEEIQEDKE